MKRFVIADIHGSYKGLLQCLERSNFNYEKDLLINLGDVVDGMPDTYLVIEELLKIKNHILILGNHDDWCLQWFNTGAMPNIWVRQGGDNTLKSYDYKFNSKHRFFLSNSKYYYVDENNNLFVHGGIKLDIPLNEQTGFDLMWDRSLTEYAYNCSRTKSCTIPNKLKFANKIFIGHTTTEHYNSTTPLKLCNVIMVDTGAGWDSGKLSIMNIDTEEFWQSDRSVELYGPNQGR